RDARPGDPTGTPDRETRPGRPTGRPGRDTRPGHPPGRALARARVAARSAPSGVTLREPTAFSGQAADADVLDLQELLDADGAALAAQAGVLDPAERGGRVGHDALVEADHAGLQRLGDPERAGDVPGEQVADQAVLGGVGGGQ